jgi:hypothetical protein
MIRINQPTGQRATKHQIKQALPHLSFADESDISEFGYPTLEPVAQPDPIDAEHRVIAGPDEEYEPGKWRQTWQQEPIPPAPVPQTVSRFQARAALHLAGLLEQVESLMQSPETDMLARLAWQDAQEFKRQSPTVLAMAAALSLDDEALDALFTTASGIEA